MNFKIHKEKGIKCYVDADFAGGYNKQHATDPKDCLSRMGFVIKYAGCPLIWTSKLQSFIALSTTKSEYIALSSSMREVIFLMQMIDEIQDNRFDMPHHTPEIKCEAFEDNSGALEVAKTPKLRPKMKHLAIQYHHFRLWTVKGLNREEPRIT